MTDLILASQIEHEAIEQALDRLVLSLDPAVLRQSLDLLTAHYEREESDLFAAAAADFGSLVAKLKAQHEEVREIGTEALKSETPEERNALTRRFHAIAQHNIIEEERDFFRLLKQPGRKPGGN